MAVWPAGPALRATPGNRWTSGLALSVALAVLLFGLPPRTELVTRQASPSPVQASPEGDLPPTRRAIAVEEPDPTARLLPVLPRAVPSQPAPPATPAGEPAVPGDVQAAPTPTPTPSVASTDPVVVLLAEPGGLPTHTDADMAAALSSARRVNATVITADLDDPATCQLVPAGALAVTSYGVGAGVRECLVASGVTLLGLDDGGVDLRPGLVSTSPGTGASLLAVASWMVEEGVATGPVGLVATTRVQPYVESVLGPLADVGLDLAEVAFVPEPALQEPAIVDAVLDFASAGVRTVVFAAPVDVQRRWLLKAALVTPGMRYVVADTRDSILDEQYPSSFEGALAHTFVRFPWRQRTDGVETVRQAGCRADWTSAAPPGPVAAAEVARAFAWCQHLDLVPGVLGVLRSGGSLIDALDPAPVEPLLTDAFPWAVDHPDSQRVILRWAAGCQCWQPQGDLALPELPR